MGAPAVFIWAKVDTTRGIALITGRRYDELVYQVAPKARWSSSGKGLVITLAELADLACLCTEDRIPFRERAA